MTTGFQTRGEVIANKFQKRNLSMAVDMIHHVERRFDIIFTDYTFQMLAEYIAIALFRVDVEKELKPDELDLSNRMRDDANDGDAGDRNRAAGTEKWIRNDRSMRTWQRRQQALLERYRRNSSHS